MKKTHTSKEWLLFVFLLWIAGSLDAPLQADTGKISSETPIGLTLGGGGARGLAHVGVLHILDSIGIRIDYITGTSMGAIVGGMYAAGYSSEELKAFALQMDWETMLTRTSDLNYIHPAHRADYGKFVLELPIVGWSLQFSTGAIEGQQLWNILNEIFLHTHGIENFDQLPIPFACVATDVSNGDAVVMRDGNLVTAIRASMAIPSVFTTVERDGLKLIDGGVADNFPVLVAREMGAEYVIGVNVSQGLRPVEELRTPIDIIYQMGFYSDARMFRKNRTETDLFIEPSLTGFTAASFTNTAQIIELGKQAARNYIEDFKEIARLQGNDRERPVAEINSHDFEIVIDSIIFKGLDNVRPWFARSVVQIEPGDTVDARALTRAVNRLFATGYFDRVHYDIESCQESDNVMLVLDIAEKPFASLSASMQFSSFTGVGISGRISTNKFFLYNTRASAAVLIGDKPAFKTNLTYFTSDRRSFWISWLSNGRYLTFPLYEDFQPITEYKQNYFRTKLAANLQSGHNSFFTLSGAYYYQSLSPNMVAPVTIEGSTRAMIAGIGWQHHSLNKNAFPTRGQLIQVHNSFYFNQKPSFPNIVVDGGKSTLEELDIRIRNFFQTHIRWDSYVPINERLTQKTQFQLGYNIKYEQGFINSFNLGGTYPFLENQITFTGLNEYELISENIMAAGIGYQYHIGRSVFTTVVANVALYDFRFGRPEEINRDKFILGGGVSVGYDGMLGPFELTFSYSPQTNNIIGYVNLGWMF